MALFLQQFLVLPAKFKAPHVTGGAGLTAVSRSAGELHLGQDQHVTVGTPLANV